MKHILISIVAGLLLLGSARAEVLPHPDGCPRTEFCGCGVARKVFGEIHGAYRALWLAANWFRFPRAEPAPGMVAVRQHHVFYIESVVGPGRVIAYDPNSGHHMTRRHEVSLAGFSVRDPHGATLQAEQAPEHHRLARVHLRRGHHAARLRHATRHHSGRSWHHAWRRR